MQGRVLISIGILVEKADFCRFFDDFWGAGEAALAAGLDEKKGKSFFQDCK